MLYGRQVFEDERDSIGGSTRRSRNSDEEQSCCFVTTNHGDTPCTEPDAGRKVATFLVV